MITENSNEKIVIIDSSKKEINIIENNSINWFLLDGGYDNCLESYLYGECGVDSNCHWFVTETLNINFK